MTGSPDNTNLRVALDEATHSLVAARQLAMPGAVEEASALILGAFEGGDIRLRVPIAYARSAAAGVVTWTEQLRLRCDRLFTALDTICDQIRPAAAQPMPPRSRRQQKPRNPSIATLIERAEKTGKAVTSITTPDGHTIHFDETKPTDANNPWPLDEFRMKETKQ